MGGVVFILVAIFSTLISARIDNSFVIGAVLTGILFFIIGLIDDIGKIKNRDNQKGFLPKTKMLFLIFASIIVSIYLLFIAKLSTSIYVPFYKYPLVDLGYFIIIFWVLVFISSANAVNLTDGLDGLATVPSIFAFFTLSILCYIVGHAIFSEYLLLPHVNGVGEVSIVGTSLIGALLGFLWYNSHPAQIFMGDSGSLALGGFLAYFAIISKNEFLLFLIGFVFVMETFSVIIQVGSYKARKKRVFRMAPIHHHFELKGWHENKIIVRFWIISLLTNILALITIKIR